MSSASREDLLIEIGTEEIPASYARPALAALESGLRSALAEARLEPGETRVAATPRRLAVHVSDLLARQPDREVTFTGPKEAAGFDADGNPTKAALGFLRSKGASPDEMIVVDSPKGRVCAIVRPEEGRTAAVVVAEVLASVVTGLPFPKSMRWPGADVKFARPIRGLTAWLGAEPVEVELAGLKSEGSVCGHPFLCREPIELSGASFDDYVAKLREGRVLVEIDERREAVRAGVEKCLTTAGAELEVDPRLLDEVTFLVEWPNALLGAFDEAFLELPREVLVSSMARHQRYFPVVTAEGTLRPSFVVVSNREASSADAVRAGNERVLRARLSDADYFWKHDRKRPLDDRRAGLADVLFHRDLGSIAEKCVRLERIVERLGAAAGSSAEEIAAATRAAALCKTDLLTEMVGEFPELQGVMGRHYALADGESADVADAIEAHYYPRGANDEPPTSRVGALLALAEQLDDLTGFFSVGKVPSGSRDPFGLRRKALGLIRLLESGPIELDLVAIIDAASGVAPGSGEDTAGAVLAFVRDRLRQTHLDAGRRHDLVDAALATDLGDLRDLARRIEALHELVDDDVWPGLVEVGERTHNIAKKVEVDPGEPLESRLVEDPERELFAALTEHRGAIEAALDAHDYAGAARRYHDAFKAPVHAFFETVYVNADDPDLRTNRLALCRTINRLLADRFAVLALVVTSAR